MEVAHIYGRLSTAEKLKVGAIIVKDDRIISIGYNGTPKGWDNACEDKVYTLKGDGYKFTHKDEYGKYYLKTKPEVLHAERNALDKLARTSESGEGSVMFVTHSPCLECAKSIYGAGITTVYYKNEYRMKDGLDFLEKSGVIVEKL